jgi:magnesium transporter
MINTLLLPELREMLAENDSAGLADYSMAMHPARAAEFMEGLDAAETWAVLRHADPERRVQIFKHLDESRQVEIIETSEHAEAARLIAAMSPDDRVDLLKQVAAETVEALLPLVPVDHRRDIHRLLQYPEGTAGALMTTNVARLPETLTVREALEEIGRQAQAQETIYYIYIVDAGNHLRGLVSARQLVTHLRTPDAPVSTLMQRDLVSVETTDDQEAVAAKVAEYNFLAIPVVDHEHRLIGIITHDDVIDVLREEAEEDAYRVGGIAPLEESYLDTPWFTLSWKRGVWLAILTCAALLTIVALRSYNESLARVEWLAWFIPLIVSAGGNSGGQSATLVITALTSGTLQTTDWRRVLRRELAMGLSLGATVGAIGYLFALAIVSGPDAPTAYDKLVIPLTLLLVVTCGTICGGALPLVFRRLGLDPALMSNPFVAGIIDITGIVVYMTVCATMLESLHK